MRLPSQGTDIQVDGDFSPSDFKIDISAHAFGVLSKGLYSDPFRAIVRELCCNAWDAHIAAGTQDKPFELYLPNTLAPVFKIRDFGVGLSENDIREVYTTYFKSTKQQSDEMTGCFGLGSKSPYAYTKKFTIVSYFHGTRFHYNAIINEKGFPQIMKAAASPTDEPNGLEISFSVQSNDFYDFERAAKVALRPFVVKPIVKGVPHFDVEEYSEPLLAGKGWRLYRKLSQSNFCVMGNVEYPIEPDRSGFSSNAKKVLSLSVVLEFPLGSFEMTPSRESIQWTDFSVKNVNDRLELIHDEIVELANKNIESSATYWEAVLNTHSYLDGTGLRDLKINTTWNGRIVKSGVDIPGDKGISLYKLVATPPRANSNSKNSVSVTKVPRVDPVPTTFYLADFPGAEHRLGNYVRDNFSRNQHAYLVSCLDATALALFCETVGIAQSELVPASTVPKRSHSGGGGGAGGRRSRLSGSKARAFQFNAAGAGYSDTYWDEAEIDLDDPDLGVYIEINRWNPENSLLGTKAPSIRNAVSALKTLGISLPDGGLVGIKTAHKSKFEANENWKTLDCFVQESLIEYWNANSDFRYAYEFFEVLDYGERNSITEVRDLYKNMSKEGLAAPTSYLARFSQTFDRIYAWEEKTKPFGELVRVLSETYSLVLPHGRRNLNQTSSNLYTKRLSARYPLMIMFLRRAHFGSTKDRAALAEYIELIDEKRRTHPTAPTPVANHDDSEDE